MYKFYTGDAKNGKSHWANFQDNIKCGPEYVCTCCDQLWYRSSVRKCEANKYSTCDGKLPDRSKANKMRFLWFLFKRDTFRRKINFSTYSIYANIRELPRGGQLCIPGNVVNVPADVNSTVSTLPRSIDESQTIPMKLKGRLSCKHHYQFQNARPRKVLEAAKYLVKTSELFKMSI